MKCVIVDDEFRGREVLKSLLAEHCPGVTVTATAGSVRQAYQVISETEPELVFLDIEMPDGDAFDLLEKLGSSSMHIIFVTSYDQYAIQAIKWHAFDYLLKPVMVEELKMAISKLEARAGQKTAGQERQEAVLEINHKTRTEYIPHQDIVMLKGDGNYTLIHTLQEKTYHTSRILKDYETLLCFPDSSFIRIHKSSIINLRHVKHFERGRVKGLVLSDGKVVEVSRRKREEVLQKLKVYTAVTKA